MTVTYGVNKYNSLKTIRIEQQTIYGLKYFIMWKYITKRIIYCALWYHLYDGEATVFLLNLFLISHEFNQFDDR